MTVCPHCTDGEAVLGSECYGIGPTRVYKVITGPCWDCDGSGEASEPLVFHDLSQSMLDSILKEKQ